MDGSTPGSAAGTVPAVPASAVPALAPPAPWAVSSRSRVWWRLGVFLVTLAIQGGDAYQRYTPNRWLYADGSFYYNILRGLVDHGSLEQSHIHPRSWFYPTQDPRAWNYNLTDDWSNVSVGRDGVTWYPKHAFLMPVATVPLYLAFGPIGSLYFNVLCGALIALLSAELAARYTARWLASLIAVGMAAMPAIVHQAYGYNNDIFYSVLVVATAVELADRRYARAGLWGGLAVLAKITNVLFLLPFGLWVLAQRDRRALVRFVGFSAIGIGAAALANWIMFGAPWTTAYDRVLIMHNGAQEIQSHFRLFSRDFNVGLAKIWDQLRGTLPAYLIGFVGCLAFAWRRRFTEALVFLLALGIPLLFFAKYFWYREEFLDVSYALAAAPLGALAGLFFAPRPEPEVPPRVWALAVGGGAALLLAIAVVRGAITLSNPPRSLARFVPDDRLTQVLLSNLPCDYFNNQVGRWECSGFDRGQEWAFTGQTLDRFPRFGGVERAPIDLNPSPSGQVRRLVFTPTWRSKLSFGYGIADGSAEVPVEVTVKLGPREIAHETVVGPGWHELPIDTVPGSHEPLEIDVEGQPTPSRQFYVDGDLQ